VRPQRCARSLQSGVVQFVNNEEVREAECGGRIGILLIWSSFKPEFSGVNLGVSGSEGAGWRLALTLTRKNIVYSAKPVNCGDDWQLIGLGGSVAASTGTAVGVAALVIAGQGAAGRTRQKRRSRVA
jgi:hypothetical protein